MLQSQSRSRSQMRRPLQLVLLAERQPPRRCQRHHRHHRSQRHRGGPAVAAAATAAARQRGGGSNDRCPSSSKRTRERSPFKINTVPRTPFISLGRTPFPPLRLPDWCAPSQSAYPDQAQQTQPQPPPQLPAITNMSHSSHIRSKSRPVHVVS